jgi:hypothetical protein
MTGLPVPVGTLNLIRAVWGIHHHRFDLFVKCSSRHISSCRPQHRRKTGIRNLQPRFRCPRIRRKAQDRHRSEATEDPRAALPRPSTCPAASCPGRRGPMGCFGTGNNGSHPNPILPHAFTMPTPGAPANPWRGDCRACQAHLQGPPARPAARATQIASAVVRPWVAGRRSGQAVVARGIGLFPLAAARNFGVAA